MSENWNEVPRRATGQASDGLDDTPEVETTLARRGPLVEPDSPFARPGDGAVPPPAALPDSEVPTLDPYRADDDTPPVPRRSAASTTSASDIDLIPAPVPKASAEPATQTPPPHDWLRDHRRTLLIWLTGALVMALAVAVGVYALRGGARPATSPTASPTSTASAVPAVTVDDLMTPEDAALMVPGASWVVTATAGTPSEATARAACLSASDQKVNTLATFQRTLGTSEPGQLAALQQLDVYSTAQAAEAVQATRVATLAACTEVPARIVSSIAITGLADEAQQVTIAYDDDPIQYHTVLLLRTGLALTILDVTRTSEPVTAESAVAGLLRPLNAVCKVVEGTCPGTPTFAPSVPPSADPAGWLLTSDFPRISPGAGKWTGTAPAALTSHGMGCENMTLASEPGPTDRKQRTYLLTQDPKVPATFGVDEMRFEFADEATASAFVTKLTDNLANCKDRVLTANVSELTAVNGTGASDLPVSARSFVIDQATSDNASVSYQVSVAVAGKTVSYLLASVTADFRFTEDQMGALALRSAQRLSQ